jgi:hypothetical protein
MLPAPLKWRRYCYGHDNSEAFGLDVQTSFNNISGNEISGYATGTKLRLDDNIVKSNFIHQAVLE